MLKINDFGDEIDCNTPWEQYLCDVCYDKIWKELLDSACGVCNTHPCERGRECWVNPWPKIMYLCYVGHRKDHKNNNKNNNKNYEHDSVKIEIIEIKNNNKLLTDFGIEVGG